MLWIQLDVSTPPRIFVTGLALDRASSVAAYTKAKSTQSLPRPNKCSLEAIKRRVFLGTKLYPKKISQQSVQQQSKIFCTENLWTHAKFNWGVFAQATCDLPRSAPSLRQFYWVTMPLASLLCIEP